GMGNEEAAIVLDNGAHQQFYFQSICSTGLRPDNLALGIVAKTFPSTALRYGIRDDRTDGSDGRLGIDSGVSNAKRNDNPCRS
ncbi:MAG: hypothetical protein ACE5M4_13475, partial [Anaerolineales bacterium]